ncbi:hypothetical protein [Streptomyces sp. Ncost-T10-10d]|uniref:hypothetical protein n=1 Tax=Streptomyces sp. Ncost-T10-10d TaxID=1839774 RepID=UPI00081EDF8E|nr:hypothetical protein [Streptomyces sp. Ncost-T10-10d]SCF94518.1 hypothetical protein GA0115254_126623 [Streptomyces sp. Ncost-T10-10d]
MITSGLVGEWNWEIRPNTGRFQPARAAEIALAVWGILAANELAVPVGKVGLSVLSMEDKRNVLIDFRGLDLEPEPLRPGTDLSRAVAQADALEGNHLVIVRIQCPGLWLESGVKHRAEKLFAIHLEVWGGSLLSLTLETYSDSWLTMDTRDREQPEVYAANAPRLAAALQGVSALLGSAPEPGDENRHAAPNETGFKDLRGRGPAYDDSWGTFEGLNRADLLQSRIPQSEDEYEQITEHPVRYFTIQRDGRTLGFVWASVGDAAAGYVPRTAAGDEAFDVGAAWLLSLREAHDRGLAPLAALDWLAKCPTRPEIGVIAEDTPQGASSLDALEELSGRY